MFSRPLFEAAGRDLGYYFPSLPSQRLLHRNSRIQSDAVQSITFIPGLEGRAHCRQRSAG